MNEVLPKLGYFWKSLGVVVPFMWKGRNFFTVADNPLPNTINYLFNHEKHESRENSMIPVADVTEMVGP